MRRYDLLAVLTLERVDLLPASGVFWRKLR